jgi:hypothetical protein
MTLKQYNDSKGPDGLGIHYDLTTLIMAALRTGSYAQTRLMAAFPEIYVEFRYRYWSGGGLMPGEDGYDPACDDNLRPMNSAEGQSHLAKAFARIGDQLGITPIIAKEIIDEAAAGDTELDELRKEPQVIIDEGPYFEETGKLFPPGVTTRAEAEAAEVETVERVDEHGRVNRYPVDHQPEPYTCPYEDCRQLSYNPHDKTEGYCGSCHRYAVDHT